MGPRLPRLGPTDAYGIVQLHTWPPFEEAALPGRQAQVCWGRGGVPLGGVQALCRPGHTTCTCTAHGHTRVTLLPPRRTSRVGSSRARSCDQAESYDHLRGQLTLCTCMVDQFFGQPPGGAHCHTDTMWCIVGADCWGVGSRPGEWSGPIGMRRHGGKSLACYPLRHKVTVNGRI